ncbi:MAG: acyl-CoA thioesterase [Candidatus Parvarchaeota archaeon]|nr:acyl-CoA thioesterase [Candidatus Parvarchaeota archaeon]MCW1301518.1 acyl-CoA thioesterase [Candidatus Parvarchaeota archaeon]
MDTFIKKETVRIYDVDAQGVVHYAAYYRFFTDTLEDYSRSKFGNYLSEISKDTWFVTVESKATYHRPVKLGDVLEIHMNMNIISKSAIRFDFSVFSGEKLAAEGYITQVCIDPKAWKAKPIPDELKNRIN